MKDSFLFDLIPPLWLDFVPTGAKERQGEGNFARGQRVKFQAPLQITGYSSAHHGRAARTRFNLSPTSKRGLVRRGKGGIKAVTPWYMVELKRLLQK